MPFDPFFMSANSKPKKHSAEVNAAWDEFIRKDKADQKLQLRDIYDRKDAGKHLSDSDYNIMRRNGIRAAYRRTLFTRTIQHQQHRAPYVSTVQGLNTASR